MMVPSKIFNAEINILSVKSLAKGSQELRFLPLASHIGEFHIGDFSDGAVFIVVIETVGANVNSDNFQAILSINGAIGDNGLW